MTKIFSTMSEGAADTTFFTGDGLTLTQSCDGSGNNNINYSATNDQSEMNTAGNNNNSFFGDLEDGVTTGSLFGASTDNEGNVVINYSTLTGQVVTIEVGFDYPDSFNNQHLCGVWGTATVS